MMTSKTRQRLNIDEQELLLWYSKLYLGKTGENLLLLSALQGLHRSGSTALLALRALHAIAQMHGCGMRSSDYELVERSCRQTTKGLKKYFDEDRKPHMIYHRSLTLLASICRLKGDDATASAYLILTSSNSHTEKDRMLDGVPEPSTHNIRVSIYTLKIGDKVRLLIFHLRNRLEHEKEDFRESGSFNCAVGDMRKLPSRMQGNLTYLFTNGL